MGLIRLWQRLAQPRRGIFASSMGMAMLSLASGVALLAVSAWLITRASERPAILTLTVAIVAVRFFGLARPVFRYIERVVSHEAVLGTLGTIRATMVRALSQASPTHPLFARRGELLSRLVGDVEKSQDYFLRLLSPVVSAVAVVALASTLEFTINPVAGVLMATGLLGTLLVGAFASMLSARTAATAVERGQLSAAINELVRGAEELHMWQAADRERERVLILDRAVTAKAQRAVRGLGSGSFATLLGLGTTFAIITPVALGAYQRGAMAWPTMAVLVLLPLALLDVILPVPQAMALAAEIRSSLTRIDSVVEPPKPTISAEPAASDVALRDVVFSWDGGRDHLRQISLDIPAGRKVAVVGTSGSGKTSLALILAGLLEPQHGSARIGDHEIARLSDEVRAKWISFAAQDAFLFNTSIRENLLIADPQLSDAAMHGVLGQVGLGTWVDLVGLEHVVGEGGSRISGGQRRRLTIARALAVGAPITIVDEPTAHLDLAGGDALLRSLLAGPDTRIIITHRLAPLTDGIADLIVVVEQGQIVEFGTHAELSVMHGCYQALLHAEAAGMIGPKVPARLYA